MSQSHFSKLDTLEKETRLMQLGQAQGEFTLWVKGNKLKHRLKSSQFIKDRQELSIDNSENLYPLGTQLLCSFYLRGMTFFSQVTIQKDILGNNILLFKNDLFKSERRASYRLLTFPIYEVFAEFDFKDSYQGSNVIGLKSKSNQTALFKNFLKLIENRDDSNQTIRYRIQDLSVTGMALHISEIEAPFFEKEKVYKNIRLVFKDESIVIPEVLVVYVVDYLGSDRNLKKYKVGLHFLNLPSNIDDLLGGKINKLLREIDANKDFENFLK